MPTENKRFSIVKRAKSFSHAWRGIGIFLRTTHNSWIQIFACIIVVILGFYFEISSFEWLALIFSSGLVFVSEAFNTAIEIDMDLTSPEFHPFARDTKDVAAGAVLLSAITSFVIGIIIFLPHIIFLFG